MLETTSFHIQIKSLHKESPLLAGVVYPTFNGSIVIGRHPDVELVLADVSVSGRHLQLKPTEKGFLVRNLSEHGSTFVHGQKLGQGAELLVDAPKFYVQVGRVLLKVAAHEVTLPVDDPLPIPGPPSSIRPVERTPPTNEPFLTIRKGEVPRIWLLGVPVALFPSAARLLARLCDTPGRIVETAELAEAMDPEYFQKAGGGNLNQNVTYVRKMFLKAFEDGTITLELLQDIIGRCPESKQTALETSNPKALMRVLVSNVRGAGYQLMVPASAVQVKSL